LDDDDRRHCRTRTNLKYEFHDISVSPYRHISISTYRHIDISTYRHIALTGL
jgi:hypothetical protein